MLGTSVATAPPYFPLLLVVHFERKKTWLMLRHHTKPMFRHHAIHLEQQRVQPASLFQRVQALIVGRGLPDVARAVPELHLAQQAQRCRCLQVCRCRPLGPWLAPCVGHCGLLCVWTRAVLPGQYRSPTQWKMKFRVSERPENRFSPCQTRCRPHLT